MINFEKNTIFHIPDNFGEIGNLKKERYSSVIFRTYASKPKKPGFSGNLWLRPNILAKNPVSGTPCVQD